MAWAWCTHVTLVGMACGLGSGVVLAMHVDIVPHRISKPAILLRETWREDGKVRKRTLVNSSDSSAPQALVLRRVWKGGTLVAPEDALHVTSSLPHGHVQAVLLAGGRRPSQASRPLRTVRANFSAYGSSLPCSIPATLMVRVMAPAVHQHPVLQRV